MTVKIRASRDSGFFQCSAILAICFAAGGSIQAQQPTDIPVRAQHHKNAAQQKNAEAPNSGATANPTQSTLANQNELDAAANPATVTFNAGQLKIETNNSDLGEILKQISTQSGMTVDGAVRSSRVFGVYGPGKPTDVLTDLLAGAGYNVIMVGGLSDGAPRELLLSARNGGPGTSGNTRQNPAMQNNEDDSDTPTDEEQPGPGAVIHAPPPGSEDPNVRMQQNLQRLQHMQDEQEKQQQQQQQNPPTPQ